MSSRVSPWASAETAVVTGDVSALERLLRENPRLFKEERPPAYVPGGPNPHYAGTDARSIIAREHHFETFDEFAEHLDALSRKDSLVSRFESAVDAIVIGDSATLERVLHDN